MSRYRWDDEQQRRAITRNDEQKYILWNCLINVPNSLYEILLNERWSFFAKKATKLVKENKIYRILHELINISKGGIEMEKIY